MTSQVIPPQAVEAALSALLPDSDIDSLKGGFWWGNVETILEAAAPHIRAEAWDDAVSEGESSGWIHDYAADDLRKRNPYK